MPDTLVLIFFVAVAAALLTYIVPTGSFQTQEVNYLVDGIEKSRSVIDPNSFSYDLDDNGEPQLAPVGLFEGNGGAGFFNFAFEGLVSGSKWGSAIGVIMFMLVIGGSFGVVMATGTIDNGILKLIDRTRGNESLFIPVIFVLFSLGGAVFGMGEEAIAFAIIICPLMIRLGYDGITTVMVTYVATQIGFASSWMNPFSVAIAQGIADIPVLSGAGVRVVLWLGFTLMGLIFTLRYANKVKLRPEYSFSYHSDAYFRENQSKASLDSRFNLGDILVLTTIIATIIWVIWGVVTQAWFIPEIASQFFTMGIVIGTIGVIFKLNAMTVNDIAISFKQGAANMLEPCILVGCASGILILLGSGGPSEPSVLNSILNSAGNFIGQLPNALSAWFMLVFQTIFNFFVTSGSGQAALTMPLMAPLADIVGVTRQVAVLAFQLGDGFSNVLVPTSASLMATLGVCRVDWGDWLRFIWRFMLVLFVVSSLVVVGAHYMGFS
ncbi:putative basic amino acid antiporter YfcC [Shewanella sp. D64]|uniref:putative basic amino acid antiporter YfcC n=1 Tax=unclassified Shewanella TaxID=196818 RepID=UPI0022BA2504|nr:MULTISPECIES: putative basic amino acid antiporter YfcC [unclassified Shewanella]MEC4724764.1 putative basic amino acid antiporter YfcC [Shewanella sp. D64]MEC4736442.1 putative basic amino acid antiporter YfcC [Shewanella sp. E94]WBJ98152.1 putative basic amino acid antiporter YfcC [Shewanella sp. MTB7]